MWKSDLLKRTIVCTFKDYKNIKKNKIKLLRTVTGHRFVAGYKIVSDIHVADDMAYITDGDNILYTVFIENWI